MRRKVRLSNENKMRKGTEKGKGGLEMSEKPRKGGHISHQEEAGHWEDFQKTKKRDKKKGGGLRKRGECQGNLQVPSIGPRLVEEMRGTSLIKRVVPDVGRERSCFPLERGETEQSRRGGWGGELVGRGSGGRRRWYSAGAGATCVKREKKTRVYTRNGKVGRTSEGAIRRAH